VTTHASQSGFGVRRSGVYAPLGLLACLPAMLGMATAAEAQPCEGAQFTGPKHYPVYADVDPILFDTADVNNDGHLDLIGAAPTPGEAPQDIVIHYGAGDGQFDAQLVNMGVTVQGVAAARDFNNDGNVDLFLKPSRVMLGDGSGGFEWLPSFVPLEIELKALTGDFNDDGNEDVGWLNESGVAVLLGNGDGTFQNQPIEEFVASDTTDAVVVDFNNDGAPEIAVTNAFDNEVVVLEYDHAKDGFSETNWPLEAEPVSLDAGDFNADGHSDLAVAIQDIDAKPEFFAIAILLNDGTGNFEAAPNVPAGDVFEHGISSFGNIVAADFTGDGAADILIEQRPTNPETNGSFGALLSQFVGQGDGTFIHDINTTAGFESESLHTVDLDQDGDSDLLATIDTHNQFYGLEPDDLETVAVLYNCEGGCHVDIAGGDNFVDVSDLLALLSNWNTVGSGANIAPPFDLVDVSDLLALLARWNQSCPDFTNVPDAAYAYDDGVADGEMFFNAGGASNPVAVDALLFHRYEAVAGNDTINQICMTWGLYSAAVYDGQPMEWVVYDADESDPNDPELWTVLANGEGAIEGGAMFGNNFQCFDIPPTEVEGNFFVGVRYFIPAGGLFAVETSLDPDDNLVGYGAENGNDEDGFDADICDPTSFDTLLFSGTQPWLTWGWMLRAD